jgi:hypothetical protein
LGHYDLDFLNPSHSSLTPAQPLATFALDMKITLHQEGTVLTAAQSKALASREYAIRNYFTNGAVEIWDRKSLMVLYISKSGKVS